MNPTEYLKDVPQDNYFRLADGRIMKNLEELFSTIQDSNDSVFFDHVTPDRNDFASWVKECVKDQELYNKLMAVKDKQSFLNVLGQEIDTLKNPKISETMKFFSEDYDPKKDNQLTQQTAVEQATQTSSQASAQASVSGATPSGSAASSDSELDFEQVLGSIIQEIQEEMFFWQ